MIKKISCYLIGIILLMACNKKKGYSVQVFPIYNGYGYTIRMNKKIIIKQKYIPVITEKKVFCTIIEATKTAEFIIAKLKNKQSPSINLLELEGLGINRTCIVSS